MCFEASDMTSRRSFKTPVPAELVPHICVYIEQHRPVLLTCAKQVLPPTNALWISSQGKPRCEAAISRQVRDRTMKAFGVAMTPQFFRDALATFKAGVAPVNIADASTVSAMATWSCPQTLQPFHRKPGPVFDTAN